MSSRPARHPGPPRAGRRARRRASSSPRKVTNASASFSVERDGAARGRCSRGMPIGHGLPLSRVADARPRRSHRRTSITCRRGAARRRRRASTPARRQRRAQVAHEGCAPAATSACLRWCPDARSRAQPNGAHGASDVDGRDERRDAVRARPRARRIRDQHDRPVREEHAAREHRRRAAQHASTAATDVERRAERRDDEAAAGHDAPAYANARRRAERLEVARDLGLEARAAMRDERERHRCGSARQLAQSGATSSSAWRTWPSKPRHRRRAQNSASTIACSVASAAASNSAFEQRLGEHRCSRIGVRGACGHASRPWRTRARCRRCRGRSTSRCARCPPRRAWRRDAAGGDRAARRGHAPR